MGATVRVKYAMPPWQMILAATSMTMKNAPISNRVGSTGTPK